MLARMQRLPSWLSLNFMVVPRGVGAPHPPKKRLDEDFEAFRAAQFACHG